MSTPSEQYPAPSTLPPVRPPRRQLPLGVAVLAVLVGLYGFFLTLWGILLAVAVTIPAFFHSFGSGASFGLSGLLYGVVLLIVGLIILGIGVALWRLRLWALVLGLLFLGFEMVSYAVAGHIVSFGFLLSLVIFVYLLAVNRHFR